mgnify:CR=1 FL=1
MSGNTDTFKRVLRDIKRVMRDIVGEYSPEESEIFDDLYASIEDNAGVILEKGEKILDSESALGFFGGGIFTLALALIVSEAVKVLIEKAVDSGLSKLKKIAMRIIGKSHTELNKKEIEDIAERLINAVISGGGRKY